MRAVTRASLGSALLAGLLLGASSALAQGIIVTTPPETAPDPSGAPGMPGVGPRVVPPPPAAAPAVKPQAPKKKQASTEKPAPAKKPPSDKGANGSSGGDGKANLTIAILVNDEPITAYEIEQRASFLAMQGGGNMGAEFKAKAEARWKEIVKDPGLNDRFKALLQKNNVKTQEEARALQTKFIKELQQNMVEGLKREMRARALAGSKDKARDELIDEKLKLQDAKRLGAVADDADVDKILSGIAERNKMTLAQFTDHMKGMGTDIGTMRSRFKAEMSWREVIRRQFGRQVAITDREVDKLVANTPQAEDQVELQVQRITFTLPAKADQSAIAVRMAEASGLANRFNGCASTSGLAAGVTGAKFEDLGVRKPVSIPEPTRSLLLNAAEGDMLPPSVGQGGVELWALCSRKALKADTTQRENAEAELRQKEFEILAQKHLKDLRQDAAIEYR